MAANYRTSKYRTTSLSERDKSGFYVYGNTVRQAETLPRKTKSPYSQQREQTICRRRQKRNQTAVQKVRNSEYLNGHKLGVYHIETNFRGEGRTLRKIQKRKGHLSWQQTIVHPNTERQV